MQIFSSPLKNFISEENYSIQNVMEDLALHSFLERKKANVIKKETWLRLLSKDKEDPLGN